MGRRRDAASDQRRAVGEALVHLVKQALERGETPPWRKPWVGGFGQNRSGRSGGRPYQNWNAISVWTRAMKDECRAIDWYTEAEGQRRGWTLVEAAQGAPILLPMFSADGGRRWGATFVYNREAFEGPSQAEAPVWEPGRGVARVAAMLEGAQLTLARESCAFFHTTEDWIGLPPPRTFDSAHSWAATALHELVHWTGYHTRLNRGFSHEDYALEELTAELGASMLAARLELPATRIEDEQHQNYLTIWAARIEEDPDALVDALDRADAAAGFLEALVPEALTLDATMGLDEVPRRFRNGPFWDFRTKQELPTVPQTPAAFVLGEAAAAELDTWRAALDAWAYGAPAPVLVVGGLPGDGAETVAAWLLDYWSAMTPVSETGLALQRPRLPGRRALATSDELPAFLMCDTGFDPGRQDKLTRPTHARALSTWWKDVDRTWPKVLVARCGRPKSVPDGLFVLDLVREPLTKTFANELQKRTPRRWLPVGLRAPRNTRLLESWGRRLQGSRPWLDGHRHASPGALRRLPIAATAPLAPVVLSTLQAIADACARQGARHTLASLVLPALGRTTEIRSWQLIPLDTLLWDLAPRDPEAGPPSLRLRVWLIVAVLQKLCPEMTRGTKALAALLADSVDTDMDAFCHELPARLRGARKKRRRGDLYRADRAWSVHGRPPSAVVHVLEALSR